MEHVIPMLICLGDFIGNGPIDPIRFGSLGSRCDLIADIKDYLVDTGSLLGERQIARKVTP